MTDLQPKRNVDDYTEDITERVRWARLCNDNRPAPGWTADEKLAVFVILEDNLSLAQVGFTAETALKQVATAMLNPPRNMSAWAQRVRDALADTTE